MMKCKIFALSVMMLVPVLCTAQRSDRSYLRKGNSLYDDSLFVKAQENYLKAIDANPDMYQAMYNLGNSYIAQQKPNEAIEQLRKTSNLLESEKKTLMSGEQSKTQQKRLENCKKELAQTYHNAGVVYHMSEQYDKAVESYKMALRNNPDDNETRYNMILAQKMLKEQQNQQQNQQQQDQQNQQDQQQQQNQQNQQDQQDQQQDQQQQNRQDQQEDRQNMSKENAEQLLDAAMQDEQDVQERVQQLMKVSPKKQLEKDW
ncbi:MAG: tetratricopeptide repeat protein [Bacteroidaceae bacterium]|nr:tetratricopeptide repeat protein [Bacteroidaceae bacterium]